ncbi:MAG: hypothetical protein RIT81_23980 [Deltaproteobacteria bacterium]
MHLGTLAPVALVALTTVAAESNAHAAGKVELEVVVIEASKTGKSPAPEGVSAKVVKELKSFGFNTIRVSDRITASVENEASVSVEFRPKPNEKKKRQMLKVTVLEKKKEVTRLKIALPSIPFSAETEHKKGGTFLVAVKGKNADAVFLAVTPKP